MSQSSVMTMNQKHKMKHKHFQFKEDEKYLNKYILKKSPVSTRKRGSRITITTVDWSNSVNNMRSRQHKTTAHQQLQGL